MSSKPEFLVLEDVELRSLPACKLVVVVVYPSSSMLAPPALRGGKKCLDKGSALPTKFLEIDRADVLPLNVAEPVTIKLNSDRR